MKVSELSFSKPNFVDSKTVLAEAMASMCKDWLDPFPVVEQNKLVGVLFSRVLLNTILRTNDWKSLNAKSVMTCALYIRNICKLSDDISTPEKLLRSGARHGFVLDGLRFVGTLKLAQIEDEMRFRDQEKKDRSNPLLEGNKDWPTDLHNL